MTAASKDKFVAFVDILGFKDMVAAAEAGTGRSLAEIQDILVELGHLKNRAFYRAHGPQICPCSPRLEDHLDFEVTQVSDCTIASAEISPAGIMNLAHHCWGAAIVLMTKGVMVRGYITRGPIFHEGNQFIGTGYQHAYERESGVTAFKKEADEKGTPFVEIDPAVCDYVRDQPDDCVKEMFGRLVKSDGAVTALFPFKQIEHSFAFGGYGVPKFDPDKERGSNDVVRQRLVRTKSDLMRYIDPTNERAVRKVRHYIAALDEQLTNCDRTDKFIDDLCRPIGRR